MWKKRVTLRGIYVEGVILIPKLLSSELTNCGGTGRHSQLAKRMFEGNGKSKKEGVETEFS